MKGIEHCIGKRRALAAALLFSCLAVPLEVSADDIEVYLSAPASLPRPNVLFLLDRSGSMSLKAEGKFPRWGEQSRMDQLGSSMQTILTNEELYNINAAILSYTGTLDDDKRVYLTVEHDFVDASIADNRTSLIRAVNALKPFGSTPTANALKEAVSWMQGLDPYISPGQYQCQENRIILLTDGLANYSDYSENPFDKSQECDDGYPFYSVEKDKEWYENLDGICSKEIIATGYTTDIRTSGTDIEGNPWDGLQNVITDTIGFYTSVIPHAENFLREIVKGQNGTLDDATPSEGGFYTANSVNDLVQVFSTLLTDAAITTEVAYAAPNIPVNADNGIINRNELYLPLFKPEFKRYWKGNLKKYRIEFNRETGVLEISDKPGVEALNADGTFRDGTSSFWSSNDGADPLAGGVASVVNTRQRTVYTESGEKLASDILVNIAPGGMAVQGQTNSGGDASRAIDGNTDGDWNNGSVTMTDNEEIDNWWRLDLGELKPDLDSIVVWNRTDSSQELLDDFTLQLKDNDNSTVFTYTHAGPVNVSAIVNLPAGIAARHVVIEAAGTNRLSLAEVEVFQNDGYYWFVDAQKPPASTDQGRMGAPIHATPVVYQESETSSLVFLGTSDGVMHAFRDTGDSVTELWGFIPDSLIGLLDDFRKNIATSDQSSIVPPGYGIDGPLQLFEIRTGSTGKRLLVFGMRRGGNDYYALDVTDVENPSLLWKIAGGSDAFPRLGQTWGTPRLTRLAMFGDTPLLIFPGGYDPLQDATTGGRQDDTTANAIYVVDALSGSRLASISSSGADLDIGDMRNAIAADLSLVDLDSNGTTDRIYAADTGGRIIRIDFNGDGSGMSGGVVADINDGDVAGNRRFFNRPVLAYMGDHLAITIGSGRRPYLFETGVSDRFYMIRDFDVWSAPVDSDSDGKPDYPHLTGPMLSDHTAGENATTENGWFLDLAHAGMDGSGNPVLAREKSVTKAVVYDGVVYFNTLSSSKEFKDVSCGPSATSVSSFFYAVDIETGNAAIAGFDGNAEVLDPVADRSRTMKTRAIPESPFVYTGYTRVPGDNGEDILVPLDVAPITPGIGEQAESRPNRYRAVYWESAIGD